MCFSIRRFSFGFSKYCSLICWLSSAGWRVLCYGWLTLKWSVSAFTSTLLLCALECTPTCSLCSFNTFLRPCGRQPGNRVWPHDPVRVSLNVKCQLWRSSWFCLREWIRGRPYLVGFCHAASRVAPVLYFTRSRWASKPEKLTAHWQGCESF